MIPGGYIPEKSTGDEPNNTSRDELCILNAGKSKASLNITLYYDDREPVGPYQLEVEAKRTRHVRVNDLIDPEAAPLATPYAVVIESDEEIVVQLTRVDTSSGTMAFSFMMAYPVV